MEKQFYTYTYYDHRNGNVPVYVGKGSGRRAFRHINLRRKHYLFHLLQKMQAEGRRIFVGIINCPDEEFAFLLEAELISKYGRRDIGTGTLFNLTDGGEGPSGSITWNKGKKGLLRHTDEAKRKISEASKRRKVSFETRAKMSAAQKALSASGLKAPGTPKGSKRTPEIGAKISAAKIGKKRPPASLETRSKLSVAARAAWESGRMNGGTALQDCASRSNKLSESLKLAWASGKRSRVMPEETRCKIAASSKNRSPISEETRQRITAAALAREEKKRNVL